jgi:hypothetical protein
LQGLPIAILSVFKWLEEKAIDRTKIGPDQIGHLVAGGFCQMCKAEKVRAHAHA